MTISNIARVSDWNDEKGYGFAFANGKKYFVHRSALGPITRNPKVGDTIVVTQFLETPKGSRISAGTLEGVPLRQVSHNRKPYVPGYYRKMKLKWALVILVLSVPFMILSWCTTLPSQNNASHSSQNADASVIHNSVRTIPDPSDYQEPSTYESPYRCDGRVHCSQMNSYEEALFFLRNCPGTQMDGDGDGIPCERQFGR